MPRVHERAILSFLVETGREFSLPLDVLQPVYLKFLDHVFPEVEKSTPQERDAAYQRIFDYVDSLERDAEMTVEQGIRIGQLKERSRSDKYWARKTMKNIAGLEYSGASERFVKRITNGSATATNGDATH